MSIDYQIEAVGSIRHGQGVDHFDYPSEAEKRRNGEDTPAGIAGPVPDFDKSRIPQDPKDQWAQVEKNFVNMTTDMMNTMVKTFEKQFKKVQKEMGGE